MFFSQKMDMDAPRILIVEDNSDLVELFSIAFEGRGFLVSIAQNGMEGITRTLDEKPDIILLDLMMPQVDGYEMLTALRKNSSIRAPIIVNSNLSQEKDIQKALNAGADEYLRKSDYTPDEVAERVEDIFAEHKSRAHQENQEKKGELHTLEKFFQLFFPKEFCDRFILTEVASDTRNWVLSFEENMSATDFPPKYAEQKWDALGLSSPQKYEHFPVGDKTATLLISHRLWKTQGDHRVFLRLLKKTGRQYDHEWICVSSAV